MAAREILTIRYYCHYIPTVIKPVKLNRSLKFSIFYMKQPYTIRPLRCI